MIIHQALHGYSRGHRLLSSSIELPRHADRLVAIQSDLSGSSTIDEFDGYLSGYPVPATRFYAFAKTWYAREHSRPGCVWTHTLLIDKGDLPSLSGEASVSLFRRPKETDETQESYTTPLRAELPNLDITLSRSHHEKVLAAAIFNAQSLPVLVPSESAQEYEQVLLVLWDMMWARMKSSLTFSTGSFANRTIENTFDIQVVPTSLIRRVSREAKKSLVVDVSDETDSDNWTRKWFDTVRQQSDGQTYKSFLLDLAEFPANRSFFPVAATLYSNDGELNARSLLAAARSVYAENDIAQVNSVIVETAFNSSGSSAFGVSKRSLIAEMCMPEAVSNVHGQEDALIRLAGKFAEANQDLVVDIIKDITNRGLNEVGIRLARTFLEAVPRTPEVLAELQDTLPAMAELDPEICSLPEVWNGNYRQRHDLFDALTQHDTIPVETGDRILHAILNSGCESMARQSVRRFGSRALFEVLNWINASASDRRRHLQSDWKNELRSHKSTTLDWLVKQSSPLRQETAVLLADYLEPSYISERKVAAYVWPITTQAVVQPDDELERIAFFLISISMRSVDSDYSSVASWAFGTVHKAIIRDTVGYEEWGWLSDILPSLGFMSNWDKGERLRRGFISHIRSKKWPIETLVNVKVAPEDWLQLLKSCHSTDDGRWLLKKIESAVSRNSLELPAGKSLAL